VAELVGTKTKSIETAVRKLLSNPGALAAMKRKRMPYGDGHASGRIVEVMVSHLQKQLNLQEPLVLPVEDGLAPGCARSPEESIVASSLWRALRRIMFPFNGDTIFVNPPSLSL
jgi:hypothetical protein